MTDAMSATLMITVILCALSAGVFLGFSTLVMPGLARLSRGEGAAAMRAMNRGENNPVFLLGVLGATPFCVASVVLAVLHWGEPGSSFALAGSVLFLLGAVVLTVVYHVPRNNRLAALDPSEQATATYWSTYLAEWTRWNHVRAAAALIAAVLCAVALVR